MGQSIKSLTEQMKDITVSGFVVDKLKRGDYGYNLVYGTVDGTIEVAFRVDYQKDDDPNAPLAISHALSEGVETVRLISQKLSPKYARLVKYIDGWILTEYEMGYEVEGNRIEFNIPKCYWTCEQLDRPPVAYTSQELVAVMKRLIEVYTKQLKLLLNVKNFRLIAIELNGERSTIEENGRWRFVNNYIVTGLCSGQVLTFTVDNLETVNIKKRIKQEIKISNKNSVLLKKI